MAKGVEVWDMSVMKSNQVVKFAGIDGRPRQGLKCSEGRYDKSDVDRVSGLHGAVRYGCETTTSRSDLA